MEVLFGIGDVLCEIVLCYRVLRLFEEEFRCMKLVCFDFLYKLICIMNVIRVVWYWYE